MSQELTETRGIPITNRVLEPEGNAFGHSVFSFPSDQVDSFYQENEFAFEKTGKASYLRSMKIPATFFGEQPPGIKRDILISQKSKYPSKRALLLLDSNRRVVFSGPKLVEGTTHDPSEILQLKEGDGSYKAALDLSTGYARYTRTYSNKPASEAKVAYLPAMFLQVPVFYGKDFLVEVGLFRQICTNGAVDRTGSKGVKIKVADFNPVMFLAMTETLLSSLKKAATGYDGFISKLKEKAISLNEARIFVNGLLEKEQLPRTSLLKVVGQLDLIEAAKEVEAESPAKIETMFDLFDLFTFWTSRLPSFSSQTKGAAGVFRTFFDSIGGSASFHQGPNTVGIMSEIVANNIMSGDSEDV